MTPLEQLIEARARAICRAYFRISAGVYEEWDSLDVQSDWRAHRSDYMEQARATIAADLAGGWKPVRRTPTPEMLRAAEKTPGMIAVEGACVIAHVHGCGIPNFTESPIEQAITAAWDAAPGMEG